jgi:hypothetical protein
VDLGPRVALPVYVFGLILVFSFVEHAVRKRRAFSWFIILLSLGLFVTNARPAAYWMSSRHRDGQGFTSRAWKDSETVRFLKTLPSDRRIYSNAADACYLFTKREVLRLPAKYDPTGARVNTDFDAKMSAVRDEVNVNYALVIYFDNITWRWYLPDRKELEESHKLPVMTRLADGVVYGTQSAIQKTRPEFGLKRESRVEPLREDINAPSRTRDESSPSRVRL